MGIKIEVSNECKYFFQEHSNFVYTDKSCGAGFIGIPRKIMALKNLKAIIIDLNYIKGILFFLDLTGE